MICAKNNVLRLLLIIFVLVSEIPAASGQVARELQSKENIQQVIDDKDELLKDYYSLSTEPGLNNRGSRTIYEGEQLTAIQFPVGGIGTGCIQFDGNAVPRFWQIFNNMTHDHIPNSFFAIRVKDQHQVAVRALQTKDIGLFKGMQSIRAVAEFPFLRYNFKDDLPAGISMEVYNPFIPTNLKDSGIPAVFYRFTVENPTDQELEISILATQQNAVGFSKIPIVNNEVSFANNYELSIARNPVSGNSSSLYGGNWNTIATGSKSKVLYMESGLGEEHFGQMALVLFDDSNTLKEAEGIASWTDEKDLYHKFYKKGSIKGKENSDKSQKGKTWTGALNTPFVLKPGEKKVVKMALVWYFPNGKNGGHADKWDAWGNGDWEGNGNHYANHWKNIKDLMSYLETKHESLTSYSRSFSRALYDTNFPYWLVERIGNQLSILKSRTIFFDKDNYVGLWEGTGGGDGSCAGNCNHVWHYAQAHARLFPEMGRLIREQSFEAIKDNGQIPYRQPAGSPAFDGQCGDLLGAYREHLLSTDASWLKSQYPAIKKAMNYLINTHDDDRDGWLSDNSKHTTYDASMTGNPSFLSSLYLAALKASEKMATIVGDREQSNEWKIIAKKSAMLQSEKLWNGEYFIQIPGEKRNTDYENGCHADQLLGQWWADQLGLGSMYPDYKIKSATEAVLKYNFKSNLKNHNQGHRTFALPHEAGMVVTTWPNNDRTPYASGYSGEVWTTFEYTIGASLFKYNQIQDALTILRSGSKRYDGKLRTGYIGDWGNFGFSGNPFGDDECGQFYGRALSIWSILLAAQGFEYNGSEKAIGFNPKWNPDNHVSFFSAAEGWGIFTQKRADSKQINTLQVRFGSVKLSKINLHFDGKEGPSASINVNGKQVNAQLEIQGQQCIISLAEVDLREGDMLEITIDY
ncbi:GH116 family glycosyl-hydrolase [Fulvivirgaceae bacterium BMA12]|uniref:GH116 family glycosyl-hydrolase n=1 Tax=Agaribacillus aureus TaxID=3051825 RepID=A0ABT8LB96_9BACT|nr:GH116 family glycosyl-hydrolase [Fulvivirgaceae bacterium BMA12]